MRWWHAIKYDVFLNINEKVVTKCVLFHKIREEGIITGLTKVVEWLKIKGMLHKKLEDPHKNKKGLQIGEKWICKEKKRGRTETWKGHILLLQRNKWNGWTVVIINLSSS